MACLDQIGHTRPDNHHVERIAQAVSIEPSWRGCDAQDARCLPGRRNGLPCAGHAVMRLVDDQQSRLRHLIEPSRQRLDHGDGNEIVGHAMAGLDPPVPHAHGIERATDLLYDLLPMRDDRYSVVLGGGVRRDKGKGDRLARSGRGNRQHTSMRGELATDTRYELLLIGAQDGRWHIQAAACRLPSSGLSSTSTGA